MVTPKDWSSGKKTGLESDIKSIFKKSENKLTHNITKTEKKIKREDTIGMNKV
jgi:hypothetical protein